MYLCKATFHSGCVTIEPVASIGINIANSVECFCLGGSAYNII